VTTQTDMSEKPGWGATLLSMIVVLVACVARVPPALVRPTVIQLRAMVETQEILRHMLLRRRRFHLDFQEKRHLGAVKRLVARDCSDA
jgi:hypothetical protein